jgi:hypothetical protein
MSPGKTKTGDERRSEGGRFMPGNPFLPEERWMAVKPMRPQAPRTRATPHRRGWQAQQEVGGS